HSNQIPKQVQLPFHRLVQIVPKSSLHNFLAFALHPPGCSPMLFQSRAARSIHALSTIVPTANFTNCLARLHKKPSPPHIHLLYLARTPAYLLAPPTCVLSQLFHNRFS